MFDLYRWFVPLLLVIAPAHSSLAQTCVEDPFPDILQCVDGQGCSHMGGSGVLTTWEIEFVLGEEDPYGSNVLVCEPEGGCQWAAPTASDLHLAFGGNGEVGGVKTMTFVEEGEGMVFCEEDLEEGFVFDEDEVSTITIIPLDGSWTVFHDAGTLSCPGVMELEIPAGDIQDATIRVLEDGDLLRGTDLSPDTAEIDMVRTGPASFHAELEISTPEGDMTIQYDVEFVSEDMALGMITGAMSSQGFECTVKRGVLITHESATSDVEPVEDEDLS